MEVQMNGTQNIEVFKQRSKVECQAPSLCGNFTCRSTLFKIQRFLWVENVE